MNTHTMENTMYGTPMGKPQAFSVPASQGNAFPMAVLGLNDTAKSLEEALGRLRGLSERAQSIADAVFGAAPTGTGETYPPMPPVSGKMEALNRLATDLHSELTALSVQIDRLSCV